MFFVHGSGVVRMGDTTTHGGRVISGQENFISHGQPVAVVGDKVQCPKDGHGMCSIIEGHPTVTANGKSVAFHGCATSCGATLISSMLDHPPAGDTATHQSTMQHSSLHKSQHNPTEQAQQPRPLTIFLGGAGMSGDYNEEFMVVLQEAGIENPQYGNYSGPWVTDSSVSRYEIVDTFGDASSVIFFNQQEISRWDFYHDGQHWWYNPTRREDQWRRLDTPYRIMLTGNYSLNAIGINTELPRQDDQFNIIGYSWGAVVACLTARYYASRGHEVDNLVLVGAPINQSMLDWAQRMPNIRNTIIVNLDKYGDPLFAGMSDAQILAAVPELAQQFNSDKYEGHFHYSGSGTDESIRRKRELISDLIRQGLK